MERQIITPPESPVVIGWRPLADAPTPRVEAPVPGEAERSHWESVISLDELGTYLGADTAWSGETTPPIFIEVAQKLAGGKLGPVDFAGLKLCLVGRVHADGTLLSGWRLTPKDNGDLALIKGPESEGQVASGEKEGKLEMIHAVSGSRVALEVLEEDAGHFRKKYSLGLNVTKGEG